MKKILINVFVLVAVLPLLSCNDWLDVSPKTQMKAEELFSTEAGFRDALIGAYSLMCGTQSYGRDLSYAWVDALAQYYESPLKATSAGYEHSLNKAALYDWEDAGEESRISSIWQRHYSTIANLNLALQFIDVNADVFRSEDIHHIFKGELLGLRALLHFDLLRLFASSSSMENGGGLNSSSIPYLEEYTNLAQPQLTGAEVISRVKRDLMEARDLMRGRENFNHLSSIDMMYNRKQRFNYYAITALLARVQLYNNEKSAALATAKEVIGEADGQIPTHYTLATSPATKVDPMFSQELIFTLDVQNLKDISESYFVSNSASASHILTMSKTSKENVFTATGTEVDFRNIWLTQYTDGVSWVLEKFNDVNYIPMFKISELFLIAAECASEMEGYAYLNRLREHRGLNSVQFGVPGADLAGYILAEYRREFIGEGQMWFYYKRLAMNTIGTAENIGIDDPEAVYNLPLPDAELEFGNIQK